MILTPKLAVVFGLIVIEENPIQIWETGTTTLTVQVAYLLVSAMDLTVIVVVPAVAADIFPLLLTVATLGLLEV